MHLRSGPTKLILSKMIMIDNIYGFSASMAAGDKGEYADMKTEMNHNKFYGESPAPDCPSNGGYCYRGSKCGIMAAVFIRKKKALLPAAASKKPYHKIKSYGAWGGQSYLTGNEFINWTTKTREGATNGIICLNDYGADYVAPHYFFDTKINNVDPGAIAYLMAPLAKWANPSDCVDFPCTAPLNVLFTFEGTLYSQNQKFNYGSKFQLIANNEGISPYLKNCQKEEVMNAYVCRKDHLSILQFESEDEDQEDRTVSPVYISINGT